MLQYHRENDWRQKPWLEMKARNILERSTEVENVILETNFVVLELE